MLKSKVAYLKYLIRPRSFGRYIISGGLNTAVGLIGFPILYWLCNSFLSINALIVLNWAVNITFAFFLHKFVTFKSTDKAHRQIPKFLVLSLVCLAINLIVMNVVRRYTHAHPVLVLNLTSIVTAIALVVLNYFGMDRLIFPSTVKGKSIQKL